MARRLVHLDTDLGSNPDDLCALALLLGTPACELLGVTTTDDPRGQRAAAVAECLRLAGRSEIAVARPGPAAGALLEASAERGATLVAIGPLSTLAAAERSSPGLLAGVRVVFMGGWIDPPATGLPRWGPERDHNVQCDTAAAETVFAAAGALTLVPLPATLAAHLRVRELPRLRRAGPLGRLIARESEEHARTSGKAELGPAHPALPDDLLNFHHDPVACAVALGWPVAAVEPARLRLEVAGGVARWRRDRSGREVEVAVSVDDDGFRRRWLAAVETAARR